LLKKNEQAQAGAASQKSPRDCHREIVRCQFFGIKPMRIKDDLACGKVISE
jgi:hypothetical protein